LERTYAELKISSGIDIIGDLEKWSQNSPRVSLPYITTVSREDNPTSSHQCELLLLQICRTNCIKQMWCTFNVSMRLAVLFTSDFYYIDSTKRTRTTHCSVDAKLSLQVHAEW